MKLIRVLIPDLKVINDPYFMRFRGFKSLLELCNGFM